MPVKKQPNIAGKKRKRPSKATVNQADEMDEGAFHMWRMKNDAKYRNKWNAPKPLPNTKQAAKKVNAKKTAVKRKPKSVVKRKVKRK